MRKIYSLLLVLLLLVICTCSVKSQKIHKIEPSVEGLPLYLTGVSPSGDYVSGYYYQSAAALLWTEEDGLKEIFSDLGPAEAGVVSDNGVLVGQFLDPDVIFTPSWGDDPYPIMSGGYYKDNKWNSLGVLMDPADDWSGTLAEGVSADGTIIGGSMYLPNWMLQPTIWVNGEPQALEFEAVGQGARIQGLSGDGRVAAGWRAPNNSRLPVVWVDGEMRPITLNGIEVAGEAYKVSPNGKYVAVGLEGNAAIYDVEADNLILVEKVNPYDSDGGSAVSDDGILIGYTGGFPWDPRIPFVFSEKMGRYNLNEYLAELGVPEALSTDLSTPMAISADGLRMAGFTSMNSMDPITGWIVDLSHHMKGLYPASGLRAEEVSLGNINLEWTAPKADAENNHTGYDIYRNGAKIATVGIEVHTYEDKGLSNGYYTYKIVALYNAGEAARASNEVKIATANVELPFADDFSSLSLETNYWNITQGSDNRWLVNTSNGIEAPAITYYSAKGTFSEYLITPYINTAGANDLYLSYNIYVPSAWDDATKDKFIVELYDGATWTTIKEYTPYLGGSYPFVFEKLDISDAAGADIRIRFTAIANGTGESLMWSLDNINIFEAKDELVKAVPARFTAHKMDDGTVRLNWTDPSNHATLSYTNETYYWSGWIGNEGKTLIGAIKFEPEDMLCYQGYQITSISAVLTHDVTNPLNYEVPRYSIVIYEGPEKVHEQFVVTPVLNEWHEYRMNFPYTIQSSYEHPVYIGIEIVSAEPTDFTIGLVSREQIDWELGIYEFEGRSNVFSEDGGENWLVLYEENPSITGGIAVKAHLNNPAQNQTPRLLGFMVYEEGEPLLYNIYSGESQYTKLFNHTVLKPTANTTCYQVTVFYDTQENSDMKQFCLGDEVSISTVAGDKDLYTVYPNPVENTLNISGDFTRFSLMNMNGAVLLQSSENAINVSNLPTGVYFLKIESDTNAPVVKKIIKK